MGGRDGVGGGPPRRARDGPLQPLCRRGGSLRGPVAADRAGPGPLRRRRRGLGAGARRADRAARRAGRGGLLRPLPGADPRPHHGGHLPPLLDGAAGGPDRGPGARPDQRAGDPRRAAAAGRPVCGAVPAPGAPLPRCGGGGAGGGIRRRGCGGGALNVIRAARFLFGLGLQVGRRKLIRAVVLMFAGYVAGPIAALVVGLLTNALVGREASLALTLCLVAAALLVAQLMLSHFAHMDYFDVAEVAESRLRGELIGLVNGPPRIEHLDSPAFADTISLVRDWLFGTTKSLEAVLQLAGLVLQVAITVAILVSLDPWLALLPLVAVAPVFLQRRAEASVERAREASAEPVRFNRHLLELATGVDSIKELRLFETEEALLARQAAGWSRVTRTMWRAQLRAALLRAAGQALFALAY